METSVSDAPLIVMRCVLTIDDSEEEEPEEYAFPLTLKKKGSGPNSPAPMTGGPNGALAT